jgi:hypothetical protein
MYQSQQRYTDLCTDFYIHSTQLRKTFGDAQVDYSTSKTKCEGRYKAGGTVTTALGNWSHRVVDSGRDATGCDRGSYVTYGGNGVIG